MGSAFCDLQIGSDAPSDTTLCMYPDLGPAHKRAGWGPPVVAFMVKILPVCEAAPPPCPSGSSSDWSLPPEAPVWPHAAAPSNDSNTLFEPSDI